MDSLRVVTPARWLVDDFAAANPDLHVIQDLGLDLGPDPASTSWWCPMRFAGRLLASGIDPGFVTPGPRFTVRLGTRLGQHTLGRHMVACHLSDAHLLGDRWSATPVHAKLAEVKRSGVPAQVYPTLGHFLDVCAENGIPADSYAQLSDPVAMVVEARCWILNGRVVTSSVYLDHGQTWDSWPDRRDSRWAAAAASRIVDSLPSQPNAFTLDMARLDDGRVVVVEANPAWSSAPYHSDMRQVAACVTASQHDPSSPWRWQPDPAILTLRYPLPRR